MGIEFLANKALIMFRDKQRRVWPITWEGLQMEHKERIQKLENEGTEDEMIKYALEENTKEMRFFLKHDYDDNEVLDDEEFLNMMQDVIREEFAKKNRSPLAYKKRYYEM